MPKRIVFFFRTVFNKRDYIRFGFDIIRSRGYAVEAWDFSPVLRANYYRNYTPPDPVDFDGHKLYTHRKQIVDAVSGLSNEDIVVCFVGLDRDSAFIYKLLEKNNIPFGFCLLGLLPQINTHQRIIKRLYILLPNPVVSLRNMLVRLRLGMLAWMGRSQRTTSPHFMMIGGGAAKKDSRCSALDPAKVIKAHALDYDRYLEEEKLAHLNEGAAVRGYALFLDEDVPFHPDYLHSDTSPYCTADKYYGELNKFFDSFERATGLSIIVAAHPRADYKKRGNPYGNRELVFGKTIYFTKYAELILAHASTSLNFAILYKKPVIFMDSLEYSMRFRQGIHNAASAFGQKLLIVSEEHIFQLRDLSVNNDLYERYKNSYIKELGTPDKMCWDIFCDYVDELN
ncbi:MAG: hypothetical protein EPN94_12235 [Nitrospirae bacterium]|nr:MAG: hypothetical protein EPN94_12235 [Nitrospirota bacterium]